MVDHRPDFSIRDTPIEDDGVPVLLVHVISRPDSLVLLTELNGTLRVAFEIDRGGKGVERRKEEDLSPHPQSQHSIPERHILRHLSGLLQTIGTNAVERHATMAPNGGNAE
jgi:hypothetical protein